MNKPNNGQQKDKGAPAFAPGRGPMRGGPPGGGHMAGMGSGEKPKSFRKAMKTFIKYLAPYKVQLTLVLIFAIASTVFMIVVRSCSVRQLPDCLKVLSLKQRMYPAQRLILPISVISR